VPDIAAAEQEELGARLLEGEGEPLGEVDLAGAALGVADGDRAALVDGTQEQEPAWRVVGGLMTSRSSAGASLSTATTPRCGVMAPLAMTRVSSAAPPGSSRSTARMRS
jgi:hypothetical protein